MIDLALAAFAASMLAVSMLRGSGNSETVIGRCGVVPCLLNFNKHLCVYGPTRSGKTSFVRYLAHKLAKKHIVTILDWHGEYADLENIVTVEYDLVHIDVSKIPLKLLVEILGHGLGLNEPSMYLLYKILKNSKVEDISDIIKAVEEYFVTTRTEAEMKAAILRRLEYVLSSMKMGVIEPEMLVSESCCIDLSSLTVIEEKRLASSLILAMIYVHYMSSGVIYRDPRHFIIIEEAQNLLESSNSILHHIVLELAKYGVRVILITNTLPDFSILAHCNLVMYKLRPELMRNMVISDDLREIMLTIGDKEAILITSSSVRRFTPFKRGGHGKKISKGVAERSERPAVNGGSLCKNIVIDKNGREEAEKEQGKNVSNVDKKVKNDARSSGVERSCGASASVDVSRYLRKVDDVEKKLALIRERLDEIERILAYEDEILRKIVSGMS
ncbi:MAG: ATP-binding protein [Crenarchaeota archaeon]|nr:ATP-binding protein [Thermoproteota archaeon]